MRILIVAATALEIEPVVANLQAVHDSGRLKAGEYRGHAVDVLMAGVGMVATAARCAQLLTAQSYDLALNLGVCGSFDPALPPGSAVHVTEDCIADLGAEDGDAFLSIHDLKLLDGDEFPFTRGRLVNSLPPINEALRELPAVRGITVNTVHGTESSIAAVTARLSPQVESMEGASFMYTCLLSGVTFAQVRAVSNIVERRNRKAWNIPAAIDGLGRAAMRFLDHV